MRIKSLKIENFRNIKDIQILPSDEMNVIYGENAQGKTNILEAIWLFTGAKSFRGAKDEELKKFGCEKARLKIEFEAEKIKKSAQIEIIDKRKAFWEEKTLKSVSHLAGKFNAIIFSPTDLRLLSDGPKVRRKFLDTAICQLYPTYIEILREYTKSVTQRNKILKDFKNNSSVLPLLEVFEKEIAQRGEKIIKYRLRYIEILKEFIPEIYNGISNGRETLKIEYVSSFKGENLINSLKNSRKEDMFTYKTSVGPHRDDIELKINGISAKNFGSQGQKRSVALTLKLAEAKIIEKNTGEYPVCLLDDIMSELDPERQNFILNHIKDMQTFLSCCDPKTLKNLKEGKRFKIKNGEVL